MVKLFSSQRPTIYLTALPALEKFGKNDIPYEEKDGSPTQHLNNAKHPAFQRYIQTSRLACFIEPKYYEELKTRACKFDFQEES